MADAAEGMESLERNPRNELETFEWKSYMGNLPISCDGSSNRGAIEGLLAILSKPRKEHLKLDSISATKWAAGEYMARMKLNNLKMEKRVGLGAYGDVWKAKLGGEQDVAVKQLNVKKCSIESLWMERDVLIYLKTGSTRRVTNLIGAFFNVDVFFLMELCACSLSDAIVDISIKDKDRFMIQILQGLEFIHSKSIWHCDIRPDNLLVTTSNNVVLADFGKAIYAPGQNKVYCKRDLGVYYYSDWEANCKGLFSSKTDVYAAGCSIYELSTGKCLMRYSKKTDVPKYEYAQVTLIGKADEYSTEITEEMRTPLEQTFKSTRFSPVLQQMITPKWDKRLEARVILNGCVLAGLCQTLEIDIANIDNDTSDIVNVEQPKRAPLPSFEKPTASDSIETLAINLCGIYYDEQEQVNSQTFAPTLYRPLASQSGTHYIRCLKERGVLQKFVNAVSENDPISFASCAFMSEESLRNKRQTTSSSHYTGIEISGASKDLVKESTYFQRQNAEVVESKEHSEGKLQATDANLDDAGSNPVGDDNWDQMTKGYSSLDILGTTGSQEKNVCNVSEQSQDNEKHPDTTNCAGAPPFVFSKNTDMRLLLPKDVVSTDTALCLTSDVRLTLRTPVVSDQQIPNNRNLIKPFEGIKKPVEGVTFKLPKNLFGPLVPHRPSDVTFSREGPALHSLSPSCLASSSSDTAVPTSRPTPTLAHSNSRGSQRGRGAGSSVDRNGRRSLSEAFDNRNESPDCSNTGQKGSGVFGADSHVQHGAFGSHVRSSSESVDGRDKFGGLDKRTGSLSSGVDIRRGFGDFISRAGSVTYRGDGRTRFGASQGRGDGPTHPGVSDGRGGSFVSRGQSRGADSQRGSSNDGADGRIGAIAFGVDRIGEFGSRAVDCRDRSLVLGSDVRSGSAISGVSRSTTEMLKTPKEGSKNDNIDRSELKGKHASQLSIADLNKVETPRHANSSSKPNRRNENLDATKKPSKLVSLKEIASKGKEKSTKITDSEFPPTLKRPHSDALNDGCGGSKKQQKVASVQKKKSSNAEEVSKVGTCNTNVQPPQMYKCCNHDRGCRFRGERDSVSSHMMDCDMNSTDDESSSDDKSSSSSDD